MGRGRKLPQPSPSRMTWGMAWSHGLGNDQNGLPHHSQQPLSLSCPPNPLPHPIPGSLTCLACCTRTWRSRAQRMPPTPASPRQRPARRASLQFPSLLHRLRRGRLHRHAQPLALALPLPLRGRRGLLGGRLGRPARAPGGCLSPATPRPRCAAARAPCACAPPRSAPGASGAPAAPPHARPRRPRTARLGSARRAKLAPYCMITDRALELSKA